MLIVETIAKIRRAFFVQGKSIKGICRELRVSRKVVRKVIRSEATEFRYEREAQPLPKIGPWRDKLDQLLLANEGKAAQGRTGFWIRGAGFLNARSEPVLSAIVVRALAGNGDGVLAGALGDLTARLVAHLLASRFTK